MTSSRKCALRPHLSSLLLTLTLTLIAMTNPSARAYLARQFEIINQYEPGSLSSIDEPKIDEGALARAMCNQRIDPSYV